MYKIVKWCKTITDDGKDHILCKKPKKLNFKFRLLDDDGIVYAYGYSDNGSSFRPLYDYQNAYGVTEIQYKNPKTGTYEIL